jgi:hypothetical protein
MASKVMNSINELSEMVNTWVQEDPDSYEITRGAATSDGKYKETKENLLAELKKISAAIKANGGAWYTDNNTKYNVTGLVVHHQGCIGALMDDYPIYCVNEIHVNNSGKACISGWAIDNINGRETPKDLLDPKKRYFPAFMLYDVETGKYFIQDTTSMLEMYQRTLDFDDDVAPVAMGNASSRIGGCFYGMSFSEQMEAMKSRKETKVS